MKRDQCYIDKSPCTCARFSFCNDRKKAQQEKENEIRRAITPLEVTAAHIPTKDKN